MADLDDLVEAIIDIEDILEEVADPEELVEAIAALAVLSVLVVALALGGFLYVRTDVPSGVQQKVDGALERADDAPRESGPMTEKEAIDELENQYASGTLDDQELEEALTSDRPEQVVERYE